MIKSSRRDENSAGLNSNNNNNSQSQSLNAIQLNKFNQNINDVEVYKKKYGVVCATDRNCYNQSLPHKSLSQYIGSNEYCRTEATPTSQHTNQQIICFNCSLSLQLQELQIHSERCVRNNPSFSDFKDNNTAIQLIDCKLERINSYFSSLLKEHKRISIKERRALILKEIVQRTLHCNSNNINQIIAEITDEFSNNNNNRSVQDYLFFHAQQIKALIQLKMSVINSLPKSISSAKTTPFQQTNFYMTTNYKPISSPLQQKQQQQQQQQYYNVNNSYLSINTKSEATPRAGQNKQRDVNLYFPEREVNDSNNQGLLSPQTNQKQRNNIFKFIKSNESTNENKINQNKTQQFSNLILNKFNYEKQNQQNNQNNNNSSYNMRESNANIINQTTTPNYLSSTTNPLKQKQIGQAGSTNEATNADTFSNQIINSQINNQNNFNQINSHQLNHTYKKKNNNKNQQLNEYFVNQSINNKQQVFQDEISQSNTNNNPNNKNTNNIPPHRFTFAELAEQSEQIKKRNMNCNINQHSLNNNFINPTSTHNEPTFFSSQSPYLNQNNNQQNCISPLRTYPKEYEFNQFSSEQSPKMISDHKQGYHSAQQLFHQTKHDLSEQGFGQINILQSNSHIYQSQRNLNFQMAQSSIKQPNQTEGEVKRCSKQNEQTEIQQQIDPQNQQPSKRELLAQLIQKQKDLQNLQQISQHLKQTYENHQDEINRVYNINNLMQSKYPLTGRQKGLNDSSLLQLNLDNNNNNNMPQYKVQNYSQNNSSELTQASLLSPNQFGSMNEIMSDDDKQLQTIFYNLCMKEKNYLHKFHLAHKIPASLLFKEALDMNIKDEEQMKYFIQYAFENATTYIDVDKIKKSQKNQIFKNNLINRIQIQPI